MADNSASAWPDLTLSSWEDTRHSLHMWLQIVGKVRLALEPMVNHWWQVPLYLSARGLTTSVMPVDGGGLEIEFDFVDQVLDLRRTDGTATHVELDDRSVADFFAAFTAALRELGVHVDLLARPVEVVEAIPFAEDRRGGYDGDAARRLWLALLQVDRVLTVFRGRFLGKVSAVNLWWGGPDLAVTRFSGRTAPKHPGGVPNCADRVQELAYSHEVSSCGYWPGGSDEGSFYAYGYPEPPGFAEWPVESPGYYDTGLREFLLPYRAVRLAEDPDAMLLGFLQSTYEAAAELAGWDRGALEVQ